MKKLFISQPMNGKSDKEILDERNKIIDIANKYFGEVEVIDSFIKDAPANANGLWYLSKSLEFLSEADLVYFAPGWEEARGCKIEHECAIEYDVKIIAD